MSARRRRRRSGRIAVAAVALQALAACTASPPAAPPPATAATPAPQQQATRPEPPPPINDDPARLIGLDAGGLAALLGEPVRVRRDGTAEIRQFGDASRCQIDTFLYRDAGVPRVTHVEMRHGIDRLDDDASRACLRRLIRENMTS